MAHVPFLEGMKPGPLQLHPQFALRMVVWGNDRQKPNVPNSLACTLRISVRPCTSGGSTCFEWNSPATWVVCWMLGTACQGSFKTSRLTGTRVNWIASLAPTVTTAKKERARTELKARPGSGGRNAQDAPAPCNSPAPPPPPKRGGVGTHQGPEIGGLPLGFPIKAKTRAVAFEGTGLVLGQGRLPLGYQFREADPPTCTGICNRIWGL